MIEHSGKVMVYEGGSPSHLSVAVIDTEACTLLSGCQCSQASERFQNFMGTAERFPLTQSLEVVMDETSDCEIVEQTQGCVSTTQCAVLPADDNDCMITSVTQSKVTMRRDEVKREGFEPVSPS